MLTKKQQLIDEEKHISENPKTVIEYEIELTNILRDNIYLPFVITDIIFSYTRPSYVKGEYAERLNIPEDVECLCVSGMTLVEDKLFILCQKTTNKRTLYTWCCTEQKIINNTTIMTHIPNNALLVFDVLLSKNIILVANYYDACQIAAFNLVTGALISYYTVESSSNHVVNNGTATKICGLKISIDASFCCVANYHRNIIKVYDTTYFKKICNLELLELKGTICPFNGPIINIPTFSRIQQYQNKLFAVNEATGFVFVFDIDKREHIFSWRIKNKDGEPFFAKGFYVNKDHIYVIPYCPTQKLVTVYIYDLNGTYLDEFDRIPRYKSNKSIFINDPCHIISHNNKVFVLDIKNNKNQRRSAQFEQLVEKIIMYS